MSFGSVRLNPTKHAADRYCVRMLGGYETAIYSAGSHSRRIGARSKMDHVSISGSVGSSFGRNHQPRGPRAGTLFLGWLKQLFGVSLVGFNVDVRRAVGDCLLLKLVRFSIDGALLSCAPTVIRVGDPKRHDYPQSYESLACALASTQGKLNSNAAESISKRSTSMHHSRGRLRFEPLFTTEELGLPEHSNIAHVVKVFLAIGDGIAARWIEMPRCVLLLQSVAGNAESGAIYLYDRECRTFYLGVFEQGCDDDALTTTEFEQLVTEYDLLGYIENPRNLTALSRAGNA
jgi:hypothetical protein